MLCGDDYSRLHFLLIRKRSLIMSGKNQPSLKTRRLILRPFVLHDAPTVQQLAGDRAIADTVLTIPHPYEDGMAEEWIGTHRDLFECDKQATYAILRIEDDSLIRAISLNINQNHKHAEMGYWIGKPFWGKGYCTEAASEILRYGFDYLSALQP